MTQVEGKWENMSRRSLYGSVAYRPSLVGRNRWGIPELLPAKVPRTLLRLPLVPYRDGEHNALCHFFLHDDRFEAVWNRPTVATEVVRRYRAVLTPDFSLYRDMPLAAQVWNTYRTRWIGRFWQEQGLLVIPTVRWSRRASYRFCFEGISTGQVLATGTPDMREATTRRLFEQGLVEMFERLKPKGLILFGRPPKELGLRKMVPKGCRLIEHPSHWQRLREEEKARKRATR